MNKSEKKGKEGTDGFCSPAWDELIKWDVVKSNYLVTVPMPKQLRRNPVWHRAISVFSGQKRGTRIILGILQSFLHFVKAKDINSCLKWHQKQLRTRENKF